MTKFNYGGKDYPVWQNKKGYSCVALTIDGQDRAFLLHRLVYEQAHGSVPPGHEIHHLDGDRANWSVDNLTAMERHAHQEMHRRARSTKNTHKPGTQDRKTNPTHP